MRQKIHHLRRGTVAAVTVAFVTLIAAMRPTSEPSRSFQIRFGLQDQKTTAWDASLRVSGGQITSLSGWRFEDDDTTKGVSGWKASTHDYHIPQPFQSGPYRTGVDAQQPTEIWPNGVVLHVRGAAPTVTVEFKQGKVEFSAVQEIGNTTQYFNGQVEVQRLPEVSILRPAELGGAENSRQDDYPDFCVSRVNDRQYLAWVTYKQRADRVFLSERHGDDGAWSATPTEIDGPGDHFRVAIAEAGDGTLWITWSQQREGRWNIMGRPYRDGKLGAIESISTEHGPNFWHRMARDRAGRVWIVWQSFHDRQSDIWARWLDQAGWHAAVQVASNGAHNWDPCIIADTKADRVWVGWDTYEGGNYGVRVRTMSASGALGPVIIPAPCGRFQAHISLTCDSSGRLWAAWDQAGAQWGKDCGLFYPNSGGTRLYEYRHMAIRCLDGDTWRVPATELDLPERMSHFAELPRLQADEHGRIWLAFRSRTTTNQRSDGWANRGRWDIYGTCWLGDRWLPPVELPESSGRNDMRTVSDIDRDGNIYFAYASDNRTWMPPAMLARNLSIAVSRLESSLYSAARLFVQPEPLEEPERIVHPHESEDVARVRNYEMRLNGKNYHIYRGDLHRHTDISMDGIGDGSLMDLYRYANDAAALDFVMVTDHNMGNNNEYCWWRTQKSNDLYTVPGSFIVLYGYERSVQYPQGHRNIIWTERGYRTLPLPGSPLRRENDTARVYAHVKQTNGICTSHTSATNQGTDWSQHDDLLEPVVEIYQGDDASYECPDGPRAVTDHMIEVHGPRHPEGFVSEALSKGYRLGFQASSDHISTHVSYTCVIADEFSRKGLVDALKARHCYAATDNIVLDFRADGRAMMGDEINSANPNFEVFVQGTGPIDHIDLLRNGEVVYPFSVGLDASSARFQWQDQKPPVREKANYYYARVVQKDGQLAWGSPIWVK